MAAVRSVTFLCDSAASQNLFASVLCSLGFRTLWEAQPLTGLHRPDVTSQGLLSPAAAEKATVGECAIELLSLNSADAYRFNKKVRELKLLSVNVASPDASSASLAGASVARLPDFTGGGGGSSGLLGSAMAHASGLFKRIGASTGIGILPEVVFAEHASKPGGAPVDLACDAPQADGHPPPISGLLEIVVGLPHAKQAAMENALRGGGFARNRRALSVWGGSSGGAGGAAVRILPAAYTKPFSALVLNGDAAAAVQAVSAVPAPEVPAAVAAVSGAAGSITVPPVSACMYGVKGGLPSASQGQVTSALLPGLDIRVQASAVPAPYFNESQDVYGEDVDLSLNPGHSDVPPLACRSIVGMELTASWKRRMRFLQNL